jgi:uridine phosphorylase
MITYDSKTPAKFNPPNLGFDTAIEKAILVFDDEVWEDYILKQRLETFPAKNKDGRVFDDYKIIKVDDEEVLLLAPAGGYGGSAMSAADMEMLIASGVEKIVAFGTCGAMDRNIPKNTLILPTSAIREEGVSYHYLPSADEIAQKETSISTMEKIFKETSMDFITGKVWTTDAVYRETTRKIERMKNSGCVAVDMELASLLAVAEFRNIKFAEFLITDDNIDGKNSNVLPRNSEQLLDLAIKIINEL